jgi:hypothetical protein
MEYEGEQYTCTDDEWDVERLWPGKEPEEQQHKLEGLVWYMWTDGNYACDCNRGPFIEDQHDVVIPLTENEYGNTCGRTINLVGLTLDGKDLLAPTIHERLAAIGLFSLRA